MPAYAERLEGPYAQAGSLPGTAGPLGPHPPSFIGARETPVYPTIAIPSRGITSTVIANGNPNYVKVDVDCTRLFAGAEWTFYYVLSYDGSGRVSARTPSLTVPSP